MKNRKFLLILLGVFFIFQNTKGQATKEDPTDWQGWYSLSFKHNFAKKCKYELQYQARSINNLQTYNGSYFSAGAAYKIIKQLDIQAEYRQARVASAIYHRFSGGFQFSYDVKKWEFGIRGLIQNQVQDFDDPDKLAKTKGYIRFRFGAAYPIFKKLDIYASIEPIMRLGADYLIDNWRDQIGLKYKIAKGLKFEAYYMYRPDYAKATYNRYFHIIGLGLEYNLKTKWKSQTKNN